MELIDIIVHSLKLFALTSFIVLTISYTVFKMKDRKRIKPYMVAPFPSTSSPVILNDEKIAIRETPKEKIVKIDVGPVVERRRERFKIINQKSKAKEKTIIDELAAVKIKPAKKEAAYDEKDIYSFYSDNSVTPMHKLKLASS